MVRTLSLLSVLVPALATAAPKRLLVVTHTAGFRHDSIPAAERVLAQLGGRTGLYEAVFCRSAADVQEMLTPGGLSKVDAVFFANTTGDLGIPDLAAFLAWIRAGHAFFGAHSAADTYHPACETGSGYVDMLGAEFRTHGTISSVEARVEEPSHPAVAPLPERWPVTDEIYEFAASPRPRAHVLLALDRHPDDGHPEAGQPGDLPLAWASRYGDGAVFYTALGHRSEVWESAEFQAHLAGAIRWGLDLTDRASLSIPAASSAPGRFGTRFRTDLWLLNRSHSGEAVVTVRLRCAAGASCPPPSRELRLAARGTALLADVIGDLLGAPGSYGALELTWPAGQGPVTAFSRVYTEAPSGGTSGAAVPALPPSAARTRSVFVGLGSGGGSRVNAGVSNPSAEDAQVTFQLFDAGGRPLGGARAETVRASTTLQLNDVFGTLGADAGAAPTASLSVRSAVPVLPYVSMVDDASGDSVLIPPSEDE